MGIVTIIERTNLDPEFYQLLGPFLGSREVHRELGGPVYDDPGKRWWIAFDDGTPRNQGCAVHVIGFCALTVDGPTVHLGSAYVEPGHRSGGVYGALFEARLKAAKELGLKLRATARPDTAKMFRRHGFTTVRETTNYTVFELAPSATTTKKKRGAR